MLPRLLEILNSFENGLFEKTREDKISARTCNSHSHSCGHRKQKMASVLSSPRDHQNTFVSCKYCARRVSALKKETIRLHERDCVKNLLRRTFHCEQCDIIFQHRSGLIKHKRSDKHKFAAPLILGNKPVERVRSTLEEMSPKDSKDSRNCKNPVSDQSSKGARRLLRLVLPRHTASFHAATHPMLHGVPSNTFAVIMADPPFRYNRQVGTGVAENHYTTMSDDEMQALPVGNIATEQSLLMLWCSGPTLTRAAALCEAWGFVYKTVAFVWIKTNKRGEPQSMGLGSYTKPGTEFVLVATKGKGASMIIERMDQVFAAPRTGHSEKPREMRNMVDMMTGQNRDLRKLELFSRTAADNKWSVWGDQLPEDDDIDGVAEGEVSEDNNAQHDWNARM